MNDSLIDLEAVKQIIRDEHVERNELYIGSEPIPYQITEKVNMRLDVLHELLLPLLRHTPRENVKALDAELKPFISEQFIYITPEQSEAKAIDYVTMDKEFMFDMLDDLLTPKPKKERASGFDDDIILYVTKYFK